MEAGYMSPVYNPNQEHFAPTGPDVIYNQNSKLIAINAQTNFQVSRESNHSSLKCLCNHLTAFGGDILVAPNTIDFQLVQQAFDNVDPDDLLVLITLCSTFLFYFLVLVKARRADKVDATKVGAISLKIIRRSQRYYENT